MTFVGSALLPRCTACARWAPWWKEVHYDVCRCYPERLHWNRFRQLFGFSIFGLSVFGFRLMSAGKDATEEFDMLHDRKVIKKYGIDEGTVVLKGTLSKWMWRMRPAMVATFAMRPYGHFSAFSNWSSSSKPSWGSGWLSPLLMMTREKIWKTCEMSFSTCTLAQHCRVQ